MKLILHNFSFPIIMCIYINTEYWLEYSFKITTHLVNICNSSGWLLCRRYGEQKRVLKKNQHSLLQFMKGVADALLFPGKELLRTIPERP